MRACLALLLLPVVGVAGEVFLLKGEPLKGEIVRVTDKNVLVKQGDKEITTSLKEVLKIDYRDLGKPASTATYASVELVDGSLLLASRWAIKKKEMELTLLSGPSLTLPTSVVSSVMNDAQVEANRRDWRSRVINVRGKEAVVARRGEVFSTLECTLGEGDETGSSVGIAVVLDGETQTARRKLAGLHGIIFKSTLDPKAQPVMCKLLDTTQAVVMVSELSPSEGGLRVTTPAGVKIEYKNDQLARLDFTKGRLDYLSDLEPLKVIAKANLDEGEVSPWHVFRDTNLNKAPMSLGGIVYSKGLALKPEVELLYDLRGEYREFDAVVGIDDNVGAVGSTMLLVEGDGKELARLTISADDKKRYRTVTLNLKDVQKLRVLVKAEGDFDTAKHIDLADAKLRKE